MNKPPFICLTNSDSGTPIYVDSSKIDVVSTDIKGVTHVSVNTDPYEVKESPDEILQKCLNTGGDKNA